MRELVGQVDRGAVAAGVAPTVAEYLQEHWLPATRPPQVKWKTWRDRSEVIGWYVVPRIGHIRLDRLTAADINRLYAELLANGRVRTSGGLSVATVTNVHRILRKSLRDAVRWGLLAVDPSDRADPPPARVSRAARRQAMRIWTPDELRRFLRVAAEDELHPLWLVATTTGLRRSELLGLRWVDVDLDAGRLTVHQTVTEQEGGGTVMVMGQKSNASGRTIHLDRRTCEALTSHRHAQAELRETIGRLWQDHDLVFSRVDGRWHTPDSVTGRFARLVERAGVPRIRLHDARHTHASLLLQAGIHPKVVSERLGHSSVAFTLDTYSHVLPGMHPEAAERFADLAFGLPVVAAPDRATNDPDDPEEDPDHGRS
jgi:integrase